MVPDHGYIVHEVYARGTYNLRSKADCGRFTEDCARALYSVDANWGHLQKPEGRTHVVDAEGRRHAVDAVLYKAEGRSVDIILASASENPNEHPAPTWQPEDVARYSAADWYAPTGSESVPNPTPETPETPQPDPEMGRRVAALEAQHTALVTLFDRLRSDTDAQIADLKAQIAKLPTRELPLYKGRIWGINVISRPCPECK